MKIALIAAALMGLSAAKISPLEFGGALSSLCSNVTDDLVGVPQSLGRCYNRYFVCSADGGVETLSCDGCTKFDEESAECRPESEIDECQTDVDGYDILDIDDVLLACDSIEFEEPILAVNPKKSCSNVYMQCAINAMGVEEDFRYDVIAGGILYCDDAKLAFDETTQRCAERENVTVCQSPELSNSTAELGTSMLPSANKTDVTFRRRRQAPANESSTVASSFVNSTEEVKPSANSTDVEMSQGTMTTSIPEGEEDTAANSTEHWPEIPDESSTPNATEKDLVTETTTLEAPVETSQSIAASQPTSVAPINKTIESSTIEPADESSTEEEEGAYLNVTRSARRRRSLEQQMLEMNATASSPVDDSASTSGNFSLQPAVRRKRQAANETTSDEVAMLNVTSAARSRRDLEEEMAAFDDDYELSKGDVNATEPLDVKQEASATDDSLIVA